MFPENPSLWKDPMITSSKPSIHHKTLTEITKFSSITISSEDPFASVTSVLPTKSISNYLTVLSPNNPSEFAPTEEVITPSKMETKMSSLNTAKEECPPTTETTTKYLSANSKFKSPLTHKKNSNVTSHCLPPSRKTKDLHHSSRFKDHHLSSTPSMSR